MAGTLVVGNLIEAARDEHPSFDQNRHPSPVLLRALSRYQRELFAKIIRLDPSQGVQNFDQTMPLSVFENGIAIPAYKYPLGVQVQRVNGHEFHPIDLVSWAESDSHKHAGYLLNGILFLTGHASHWTHVGMVRFLYVPEPDAVPDLATDALTTVLTLIPDGAESTLVAFLASKMALRGGSGDGVAAPNPAGFLAAWQAAEERFLDEMGRNTQAVTSIVREAF